MRAILASLLVLAALPAIAQQTPADVPAAFLNPTLMKGWQVQPKTPTGEQALNLALAWAEAPNGRFMQSTDSSGALLRGQPAFAARPSRSTVGQGAQ